MLKLSHTNLDLLHWLMEYFSPIFTFVNVPKRISKESNSYRVVRVESELAISIWAHWHHEGLDTVLPYHFTDYFSWHTLAFCKYSGKYFYIQVSMLTDKDKQVLISALKDKCGLESRLTMNNTRLAISNPLSVVDKLRPLFHESQLYRLNKA